jgi:methionyl-tRNA synthetase
MGMSCDARRHEAKADDWQFLLQEKGYIYSQKHEGWYSVTDEAFYPQSAVQPYLDPSTGRKMIVRRVERMCLRSES